MLKSVATAVAAVVAAAVVAAAVVAAAGAAAAAAARSKIAIEWGLILETTAMGKAIYGRREMPPPHIPR